MNMYFHEHVIDSACILSLAITVKGELRERKHSKH